MVILDVGSIVDLVGRDIGAGVGIDPAQGAGIALSKGVGIG